MSIRSPTSGTTADAAQATTTLDELVYASHLLGSNRALANIGGGNTSAKGTLDRPRRP